jgi:hypothetical protein
MRTGILDSSSPSCSGLPATSSELRNRFSSASALFDKLTASLESGVKFYKKAQQYWYGTRSLLHILKAAIFLFCLNNSFQYSEHMEYGMFK